MAKHLGKLKDLVEESLKMLSFSDAVKNAKVKSPQSYVFHSVSVGTLTLALCEEIAKDKENGGEDAMKVLGNIYKTDYMRLCYYAGFFHDWIKLYSVIEEGRFKIPIEARQKARELAKLSGIPNSDLLIDHIANFAEGHLPNNVEMPLWASVKVADMLMVSDIYSVSDVFKLAESLNYRDAIKTLNAYNIYLSYIKSSPRLFTLLASEDIIKLIDGRPLVSYRDGLVYLSKGKKLIKLSTIFKVFHDKFHASEDISNYISEIERCINSKKDEWEELNLGKFKEVLYTQEGKGRQVNALLPSKICKPFEDIVGRLKASDKIEVAKKIIEKLGKEIPYGVLAYFVEKFSPKDEEYIRRYLGIKEKFPHYLERIKDVEPYLYKIIQALKDRYSSSELQDYTLLAFVKKSFTGDVTDDLPWIREKPKNYCIVCGMPIYDLPVRFVQYSTLLKGKTEIWIPRETGLEEVDNLRDYWAICPICHYEAEQMAGEFSPPYVLVSFYPGIPTDLLYLLSFDYSLIKFNYVDVIRNENFYNIYKNSGGDLKLKRATVGGSEMLKMEVRPDYLGSKVVLPIAKVLQIEKTSTRLTKTELNQILAYAPFISISYLVSPLFISSSIYDFPLMSSNIEIFSDINYTWLKGDESHIDNYTKMLLLLAYTAKYEALKKMSKKKDELENNLNSMINDMDLFASVDKSLAVIATGMAVEEDVFFNSIKPFVPFFNFAFRKVSQMGESFSKSLNSLAEILKEAIKGKPSKHDVVGFLRDGIDIFFRSSLLEREDRINIAASTALNTLSIKYNLSEVQTKIAFSKLKEIFSNLYDIEKNSDRSLAISISTALVNWLYVLYLYKVSGEKGE